MKIKQEYIVSQLSNLLFYGFIIDFRHKAWYIIVRKQDVLQFKFIEIIRGKS